MGLTGFPGRRDRAGGPLDAPAGGLPITASASFRGQRILVTGGSGTIGARLVDHLVGLEPEVIRIPGHDGTKWQPEP